MSLGEDLNAIHVLPASASDDEYGSGDSVDALEEEFGVIPLAPGRGMRGRSASQIVLMTEFSSESEADMNDPDVREALADAHGVETEYEYEFDPDADEYELDDEVAAIARTMDGDDLDGVHQLDQRIPSPILDPSDDATRDDATRDDATRSPISYSTDP